MVIRDNDGVALRKAGWMSNVVGGAVVVSECPDLTEVSFEQLVNIYAPAHLIERMINDPDLDQQEQDR